MAQDYELHFENKNMLFVYKNSNGLHCVESLFLRHHFRHLTGIKTTLRPNDFYKRALAKRLSEKDLGKVGSVVELKLEAFPLLKNALEKGGPIMIGKKAQGGYQIYTDVLVGSVEACMGFVEDDGSDFYVPNTLLRADVRKEAQRAFPVSLVCIKGKKEPFYRVSFCRKGFVPSCLPNGILSRIEDH
ncbi:PBECR4 domain-containing protein [Dethiosulfovibrio sp. F2B]|uniref:PBECR4 domain-containing protein n=1 Tax=Dethiosulfovibrio faecalis TaxID=2720018 RepID=UPI001F15FCB7|nr:PBECR4 domain-containing protein [Dethiosulfovibrio faecalis]MCF4150852.1 PBECR4 domain-containing protein [Dethiosulfovibrio faecalis]